MWWITSSWQFLFESEHTSNDSRLAKLRLLQYTSVILACINVIGEIIHGASILSTFTFGSLLVYIIVLGYSQLQLLTYPVKMNIKENFSVFHQLLTMFVFPTTLIASAMYNEVNK